MIEELAASEGGVFTSGQAARFGLPRYALSQAEKRGQIERLHHAAYRLSSAIDDGLDILRAIYKLTSPTMFTPERMSAAFDGVAIYGATAAYMLEIGNLRPTPWEIAVPQRFNSRMHNAKFRVRQLSQDVVFWHRLLPVTKPAETIVSLVLDNVDISLVAEALIDCVRKYGATTFDYDRLCSLLDDAQLHSLCIAAGISHKGPFELVKLDALGHVALRERGI